HVVATMTPEGSSTRVEVLTDLNITGKPAQFGRGVMQDVSDKLLGQFTACLEQKVGDSSAASAEPESSSGRSGPTHAADAPDGLADNLRDLPPRRDPAPPHEDGALDLGATVLPVLARAYWKQALGAVLLLLVLRRLLTRG
ncbi:MAG: carbon monoxide dehydrogenase subunit, partial [Marmoricola sp.]|nr:carbon monoxide dehydrogenase subunit [Marmoricola sp.]